MFIYSIREGTVAAEREDQVSEDVKHKRFDRLKELYDNSIDEMNEKYIGTIHKILIEGYSKNNENTFTGRTDSNKVIVFLPDGKHKIGDKVNIKITESHKWYLQGEILED